MKKANYILFTSALVFISCLYSTAQTDYHINVNKYYRLESNANNKTVEVEDGLFQKGKRIQQYDGYTSNGSADGFNQEWLFIPAGTVAVRGGNINAVRILNRGFLKFINEVGNNRVELGSVLNVEGADGEGSMWEIVPGTERQQIKIRSVVSNKFLQVSANSDNGSELELADESGLSRQAFTYTGFIGNQSLQVGLTVNCVLKPANNTSMFLGIKSCSFEAQSLMEINNTNSACRTFKFSKPDASAGSTLLISLVQEPALRIKLQQNTNSNGANIVIGYYIGGVSDSELSHWLIFNTPRNRSQYIIFNKLTGKCMEVWNNRTDAGATIGQNIFDNKDNQKWIIERAN